MVLALGCAAVAGASEPAPGSPEYVARDTQNVADAYGRQTGPGGQLRNPLYLAQLAPGSTAQGLQQLADQAARPGRPAISPGAVFPGWNRGNPLRDGWEETRGIRREVAFTNRYGALLRGDVFAPRPGARDPYTGAALRPPYPGVVITTGSVQGSERMYWWLAQDLAERGYVVLTYDVQGQGRSETFPHAGPVNAVPFCNPFATPAQDEQSGCPGVPAQQPSNFVVGTQDALTFFLATPSDPYANPGSEGTPVDAYNPLHALLDRSPDTRTATPGRTTRVAIVGHSLGAFAVSYVQGVDDRVEAVVALDKLSAGGSTGAGTLPPTTPVVPALGVQSEYGFTVAPYYLNNGSSLTPTPGSPMDAPDPRREEKTGFDLWRGAGVDSMVVVPRASTHLEYTDIPLALPASRYGQDLTSVYVQAWLDRYLKHRDTPLLARSFRYLEPVGAGAWAPVTLQRDDLLSFYYCSGYRLPEGTTTDLTGRGGC
jgi:hypothetical protein